MQCTTFIGLPTFLCCLSTSCHQLFERRVSSPSKLKVARALMTYYMIQKLMTYYTYLCCLTRTHSLLSVGSTLNIYRYPSWDATNSLGIFCILKKYKHLSVITENTNNDVLFVGYLFPKTYHFEIYIQFLKNNCFL